VSDSLAPLAVPVARLHGEFAQVLPAVGADVCAAKRTAALWFRQRQQQLTNTVNDVQGIHRGASGGRWSMGDQSPACQAAAAAMSRSTVIRLAIQTGSGTRVNSLPRWSFMAPHNTSDRDGWQLEVRHE
jgi:hypothetical protein